MVRVAKSLFLATTVVAIPTFAWAQTATERNASDTADSSGSGALSEVVVTAERRSERLVDVPISVNLISQDDMEIKRIDSLVDLKKSVTSLRFEGNAPAFQPSLRGVGTFDQGVGVDSSVAVYVDGVYLANNYGMYFDLPNIASIQVLKGPQGTLFGRNATGGAILISTLEPSSTFTGDVTLTRQSFADNQATAYLSGPLAEGISFGLSGFYREGDGYTTNIYTGSDTDGRIRKYSIRPDLLARFGDSFKVRLTYEHSYTLDASTLTIVNGDGYNGVGELNAFIPGLNGVIGTQFGQTGENMRPDNTNTSDATSLDAEWQLNPNLLLKSLTAYNSDKESFATDADFSSIPLEYVAAETSNSSFSQEFTLNGHYSKFDWVGGLYYFNNTGKEPNDRAVIGPVPQLGLPELTGILKSLTVKTDAFAGFLDGTYQAGSNLFLTLGIRVSTEHKVADAPELPPSPIIPVAIPAFHGEKRWTEPTPRAAIRYQFAPNTNAYVSFSQGFKSGAYTGFPPNLVNPEHIDAYEIGVKHASERFDMNASTFYYDYRDAQVTVIDVNHPTGSTLNAGHQRNYGAELEMAFHLTKDWRLSIAGAYLNATYTSFEGASMFIKGADASTFGVSGWLQVPHDATGTVVPRSPEWTGNFATTYDWHIGASTVRLSGNVNATSYFYMFPNNGFKQPGYGIVDLNATYISANYHWQVAAFVTNLTDRHYAAEITGGPVGTAYLYLPPRRYGGSLTYKF